MSKATFAVHAWNEAVAVERLLLSSLHAAPFFDEWVVLDHRSSDDLQARLRALEPVLAAHGVHLKRLREKRDLSRELTFADIRTTTIKAATNPVVALMDADFILGAAFPATLAAAIGRLLTPHSHIAAVAYPVPVIWDHLTTDAYGRVTSHGRVWVHRSKARILHRDRVTYKQTGGGGKWEKLHYLKSRAMSIDRVANDGDVLISANIKPLDRLELRRTMTMFAQEAQHGKHRRSTWLEAASRGEVAKMPHYRFVDVDLTGAQLNLANLEVRE